MPLPAADDVYVFHARGRDNPDDERLFALAEVRDVTTIRDATGTVEKLTLNKFKARAEGEAGSGADAAPYFRIFSPMGQGEKFDTDGAYVRRWVPELARLPDAPPGSGRRRSTR